MWLLHPTTKQLLEYLEASRKNIGEQMIKGACPDITNYNKLVGMVDVIDYILENEWLEPEQETEEK